MTNSEAIKLTKGIFKYIKEAKSISDLERKFDTTEELKRNKMSPESYPKINFEINYSEIKYLIEEKLIDDNLNFAADISSKITDPFTKLLYATLWKNGDLKKIKHIIKGIKDTEAENNDQENALVFHQFGKYLTKKPGEPIIDQHVIRAFALYSKTDEKDILKFRKLQLLDKTSIPIINEYKKWLVSDELTEELKQEKDYTYFIDKLLFATGKTIKTHKSKPLSPILS